MSEAALSTRPICFMVMPFGTKDTGATETNAPKKINFDLLWELALAPAIEQLGYTPVRADQDLGAVIVKDMIERLTLADLVLAEISIPNGNVYYEIGIRHAATQRGCVLVGANWSRPLFDINQMRRVVYPLPDCDVTSDQAKAIQQALLQAVPGLAAKRPPTFDLVEGYPNPTVERAAVFQQFVAQQSQFQAQVKAVRAALKTERAERTERLIGALLGTSQQPAQQPMVASVAIELILLARDFLPWEKTITLIERLPAEIRELPFVREQLALARSKSGEHVEAIGALEELIRLRGDSSERQGLLGGRYKKLYQKSSDEEERAQYLSKAIEHYERGMMLDLNDYYPSCNLPLLLKKRDEPGDHERARVIAHLVEIACERSAKLNSADEWLNPTRLVNAFHTENTDAAQKLATLVAKQGAAVWKLETAVNDLRLCLTLVKDAAVRAELEKIVVRLEKMLPPPPPPPPLPPPSP